MHTWLLENKGYFVISYINLLWINVIIDISGDKLHNLLVKLEQAPLFTYR